MVEVGAGVLNHYSRHSLSGHMVLNPSHRHFGRFTRTPATLRRSALKPINTFSSYPDSSSSFRAITGSAFFFFLSSYPHLSPCCQRWRLQLESGRKVPPWPPPSQPGELSANRWRRRCRHRREPCTSVAGERKRTGARVIVLCDSVCKTTKQKVTLASFYHYGESNPGFLWQMENEVFGKLWGAFEGAEWVKMRTCGDSSFLRKLILLFLHELWVNKHVS